MRKKIIVPTDFTVESLNLLKFILKEQQEETLDIVFIHGYNLSDSISSLLFYKKTKILDEVCSIEFEEALYILKNKFHNRIGTVTKEIFTGWNKRAFLNFIEAMNAESVLIPKGYTYSFKSRKSFDLLPMICKCRLNTREIQWNYNNGKIAEKNLSDIFIPAANLLRS